MSKKTIIEKIKEIISVYGPFGSGEVEQNGGTYSPCIASMGSLVSLAEYFTNDKVEVNIYEPESFSSDAMDSYDLTYEDLKVSTLKEILKLAKGYAEIQ
jgi:hypothetical protein